MEEGSWSWFEKERFRVSVNIALSNNLVHKKGSVLNTIVKGIGDKWWKYQRRKKL
jgi:hypothetical protein